jgi:hypothetical protein
MLTTRHAINLPYTRQELEAMFRHDAIGEEFEPISA